MFINTFLYEPQDVDCKLCTQYDGKKKRCKANGCLWLAERMEAGTMSYEEAVRETFPPNAHLDARLHAVVQRFHGSMFLTAGHRRRMEDVKRYTGYPHSKHPPSYFAALYLLTANPDLYSRAEKCFQRQGIEFDYATLKGIPTHGYTLFSAARDIYTNAEGVSLADLSNGEVVDTLAFSLIVNALLIARYGPAVLEIRERRKP